MALAVIIAAGMVYMKSTRAEAQTQLIGYVDSDRVVEEYPPAKEANSSWDEFQRKQDDQLKATVIEKYKTDDVSSLPRESQLEIQKMVEDSDNQRKAEYERINKDKWEPAKAKIQGIIEGISTQKGLMVVLEKKSVLSGGIDITDAVLKELNTPVTK